MYLHHFTSWLAVCWGKLMLQITISNITFAIAHVRDQTWQLSVEKNNATSPLIIVSMGDQMWQHIVQ